MLLILILALDKICAPFLALFPSNLTTTGILTSTSLIAEIIPSAIKSHLTMPPNILTRTTLTSASSRIILKALATLC